MELLTRVIGSFLSKGKAKEYLQEAIDLGVHGLKKPLKKILTKYLTQKQKQWNVDTIEVAKDTIKKGNSHDLTELTIKSILDGLKDQGISPGMIKRAKDQLSINPKSLWYKKEITKHPYAWRYLSLERHSDDVIYRMRNKYIGKQTSTMQLQFFHYRKVLSPVYTYKKVPNALICVMCLIPLSYITKNNYFAGAYNFFWYAWWYKQDGNNLMLRYLVSEDKLKEYTKEFRFKRLKQHKGMKPIKDIWEKKINIWKDKK